MNKISPFYSNRAGRARVRVFPQTAEIGERSKEDPTAPSLPVPRGLGAIPPRFNDEITGAREVDGSTKTFRKSLTLPDTHVPAGAPPYRGYGLAGILVPTRYFVLRVMATRECVSRGATLFGELSRSPGGRPNPNPQPRGVRCWPIAENERLSSGSSPVCSQHC